LPAPWNVRAISPGSFDIWHLFLIGALSFVIIIAVLSASDTHHSNIPSTHRLTISTGIQLWRSNWVKAPAFPYNQQVTKILPVKVRKLQNHRASTSIFLPLLDCDHFHGLFWRLRKKSICHSTGSWPWAKPKGCVVLHLSSLQRSNKYASFLKICTPCTWSFLLCRLKYDFLWVH
jgi:hypothetical protein